MYQWIDEDADLAERVARARVARQHLLEDEIQEIADTPSSHEDDVQHRKLQIYAREKWLQWNNPNRYNPKVGIGGAEGMPPLLDETERLQRVTQLMLKARVDDEQEE